MQKNLIIVLSLGFILICGGLVYCLGLNGSFQFDDIPNIVKNNSLHLTTLNLKDIAKAGLSGNAGPLKRPLAMLSFALNYYFSALSPFPYKLTNLIIHLLNSLGIYWLCLILAKKTKQPKPLLIALIVTTAWVVHPINLTSVLYVVQRMTSLSALFVILGMLLYLQARDYLSNNKTKTAIFALLATIIVAVFGVFSKENGVLIFGYLLLIELIIFRNFFLLPAKNKQIIIVFFTLTLAIPLVLISTYSILHPEWITDGYARVGFNLSQRLLTEARIVWLYILWILLPNNESLGLFHDDIILSQGLFDQTLPILAIFGHLIFLILSLILWFKNKQPLMVFGVGMFYASHLMESSFISLELTHEHRNYLGSFALLLAVFSLLKPGKKPINLINIGATGYIFLLALLTTQRSIDWNKGIDSALIEFEHHPKSAHTNYEVGRHYLLPGPAYSKTKAVEHFKTSAQLDKSSAYGLFMVLMLQNPDKQDIEPALLTDLKQRLSTGPASAMNSTFLGVLVGCYLESKCVIDKNEMFNIMLAVLSNKNLPNGGFNESVALIAISSFLASTGDYKYALDLAVVAENSSPGRIIFIRRIINLSILFKDFNTAQQYIKKLESTVYAWILEDEIQDFKKKLADSKSYLLILKNNPKPVTP